MLDNIGLMKGIGGKMNWLNQSQEVTSKNIANADTPGYRAHQLEKVDFGVVMKDAQNRPSIHQVATRSNHLGGEPKLGEADNRKSKFVYEAAPTENSVVIEEQMLKAQMDLGDYNMITNLYRKNVGMIKMAIGK